MLMFDVAFDVDIIFPSSEWNDEKTFQIIKKNTLPKIPQKLKQ